MLNPAWRPAQEHNATLDAFKQEYAAPATRNTAAPPHPIGIQVIRSWVGAGREEEIDYLACALERQLNLPEANREQQPRWQLHPTTGLSSERLPDCTLLLVLCEAELAALRAAYAELKRLRPRRDAALSVIMQDARSEAIARRHYRRLAMGSLRFLDLPLLFCGAAPPRGDHFSQGVARLAQTLSQQFTQKALLHESQGAQ